MRTIEKDEEILTYYTGNNFGSREERREALLLNFGMLCSCSECSLEGEALEENERLRAEIREVNAELARKVKVKKAIQLAEKRMKLVKKLDFRADMMSELMNYYNIAVQARRLNLPCQDPDTVKLEALKYAKMFGDSFVNFYNNYFKN